MRKFLGIITLVMGFFGFVQAETVKTKFLKPFQNLEVNLPWSLEDSGKFMVEFAHIDDEDVGFLIAQGLDLQHKAAIGKLVRQIEKAKGVFGKIPFLIQSFPQVDEKNRLENWAVQYIKGIETVKFYNTTTVYHTVTIAGEPKQKYQTKNRHLNYIFVINGKMYIASFETPEEKFSELEPFFEATIQNLWK